MQEGGASSSSGPAAVGIQGQGGPSLLTPVTGVSAVHPRGVPLPMGLETSGCRHEGGDWRGLPSGTRHL
jgi:hypothetical protein